ncbi:MAG: alkaline phosphatase family protein [Tepidanaerobacteraceae bacterium]|jgi:predicted AlkP superfamily pyrophosphatase or phosphodiesterase|nr:alkaline phosphatase family protein [Tepidanaerobacteraceae bacterium]
MLTITVQVDALRYDYISEEDSPFIVALKKNGISGSLVPTFGFEPDAAYFAGLYPEKSEGGAHYWYDPEGSPFGFTKFFPAWLDRIPQLPELVLRRIVRWAAQKKGRDSYSRCHASTGRIPFRFLKNFGFPIKQLPFQPGFVQGTTIFDILRTYDIPWFYYGSPLHRVGAETVVRRVKEELKPPVQFAFLHIGDLDGVGHRYGPDSRERKEAMRRVDGCIEAIQRIVNGRFDEVNWVIFGDHGMMQVQRYLDIMSPLEKLDLKIEKDYLLFLDSTMARFWFFNEKAKQRIGGFLSELEDGRIINGDDRRRYRIQHPHNKFGDLIFLANPGVLIFPNFYQNRHQVKGMHGYAPETPEQHSALIISSPQLKYPVRLQEPADMRRLFPTFLTLIGLDVPSTCETQSLV